MALAGDVGVLSGPGHHWLHSVVMHRLVLSAVAASQLVACATPEDEWIEDVARAVCPPSEAFDHAMCVCEDLSNVGDLHVVRGPAGVGSIAVNGTSDVVSQVDVIGTWLAYGGLTSTGDIAADKLVTAGDVDLVGTTAIRGDTVIGGDLSSVGRLSIGGRLALGGSADLFDDSLIAQRVPYRGAGAPPCGCDERRVFDVARAVRAARQNTGGEVAWSAVGTSTIRLTTGSYYVTAAEVVGDQRIAIEGKVAIFVDGSLSNVGTQQWQIAPGATLDLFVSGDVETVGDLAVTAADDAFRLYVGGDGDTGIESVGSFGFRGSIYAPRATVSLVGDADIVGAVFARSIESTGTLTLAYGTPHDPPSSCDQVPAPRGVQ